MDYIQEFDQFRDDNPGWEKLSPYEIASLFWKAGVEQERNNSHKLGGYQP